MKIIEIDDEFRKITGKNFDFDMDLETDEDLSFFMEKALTSTQNIAFHGNTRTFNISEKRFNNVMSFFKEAK